MILIVDLSCSSVRSALLALSLAHPLANLASLCSAVSAARRLCRHACLCSSVRAALLALSLAHPLANLASLCLCSAVSAARRLCRHACLCSSVRASLLARRLANLASLLCCFSCTTGSFSLSSSFKSPLSLCSWADVEVSVWLFNDAILDSQSEHKTRGRLHAHACAVEYANITTCGLHCAKYFGTRTMYNIWRRAGDGRTTYTYHTYRSRTRLPFMWGSLRLAPIK